MVLFPKIATFITVILVGHIQSIFIDVPGCPSLYQYDPDDQDDTPCFCDNSTQLSDSLVQINCLTTATIRDLGHALDRVSLSPGRVTTEVHMENAIFDEEGLPDDFFAQRKANLTSFSVSNCVTKDGRALRIGRQALRGMEASLTSVVINQCNLTGFPLALRKMGNLENLELRHVSLLAIDQEDFSELTSLTSLDLFGNLLTTFTPETASTLTNLRTLILADNYLNQSAFAAIKILSNLIELDLSSNYISKIDESTFLKLNQLKKLNLAGNELSTLNSDSFNGLENLETLDLRVNQINETSVKVFWKLKILKTLLMAGNFLNENSLQTLGLPKDLRTLDVGYNKLKHLAKNAFTQMPNLVNLDLRNNDQLHLADKSALSNLIHLQTLNLSHTNVSNFDKQTLNASRGIISLDLGNTRISTLNPDAFDNFQKTLENLALSSTNLQTLPEKLITELPKLNWIDLSNNRWDCGDKSLVGWLPKWLAKTYEETYNTVQSIDKIKCFKPEKLHDQFLVKLFNPAFVLPTTVPETTVTEPSRSAKSNFSTTTSNPINGTRGSSTVSILADKMKDTSSKNESDHEKAKTYKQNSNVVIVAVAVVVVIAAFATVCTVLVVILIVKRRKLKQNNSVSVENGSQNPKTYRNRGQENGAFRGPLDDSVEMEQRPEENLADKKVENGGVNHSLPNGLRRS